MEAKKREEILEALKTFRTEGILRAHKEGLKKILRWQDLIGTSTKEELYELYEALPLQHRETFVWVNTSTLSFDMALDILKWTTLRSAKKKALEDVDKYFEEQQAELDKRELFLIERERAFQESKKSVYRRLAEKSFVIKSLRSAVATRDELVQTLTRRVAELKSVLYADRKKAIKYDHLKAALQDALAD